MNAVHIVINLLCCKKYWTGIVVRTWVTTLSASVHGFDFHWFEQQSDISVFKYYHTCNWWPNRARQISTAIKAPNRLPAAIAKRPLSSPSPPMTEHGSSTREWVYGDAEAAVDRSTTYRSASLMREHFSTEPGSEGNPHPMRVDMVSALLQNGPRRTGDVE